MLIFISASAHNAAANCLLRPLLLASDCLARSTSCTYNTARSHGRRNVRQSRCLEQDCGTHGHPGMVDQCAKYQHWRARLVPSGQKPLRDNYHSLLSTLQTCLPAAAAPHLSVLLPELLAPAAAALNTCTFQTPLQLTVPLLFEVPTRSTTSSHAIDSCAKSCYCWQFQPASLAPGTGLHVGQQSLWGRKLLLNVWHTPMLLH